MRPRNPGGTQAEQGWETSCSFPADRRPHCVTLSQCARTFCMRSGKHPMADPAKGFRWNRQREQKLHRDHRRRNQQRQGYFVYDSSSPSRASSSATTPSQSPRTPSRMPAVRRATPSFRRTGSPSIKLLFDICGEAGNLHDATRVRIRRSPPPRPMFRWKPQRARNAAR